MKTFTSPEGNQLLVGTPAEIKSTYNSICKSTSNIFPLFTNKPNFSMSKQTYALYLEKVKSGGFSMVVVSSDTALAMLLEW